MKLYFEVTTFKSSGYIPRKSYIMSHHIWVDISPIACILAKSSLTLNEWRFNLSFSWVSYFLFWRSWGVSVEPNYYVATQPPSIQKQH